jgi:hypothetical protein
VDQRIGGLASSDNIDTTRDIQNILKRQKVQISQETIQRRLKEAGAKFSPPISKPLLTEKHRYDHLPWAQATRDMDWDRVIFSDETSVHLNQLIGNCKKTMIQSIRPNLQINRNRSIESSDFTGHQCRQTLNLLRTYGSF